MVTAVPILFMDAEKVAPTDSKLAMVVRIKTLVTSSLSQSVVESDFGILWNPNFMAVLSDFSLLFGGSWVVRI